MFRSHGWQPQQLHEVARATTLALLLHAFHNYWALQVYAIGSVSSGLLIDNTKGEFLPQDSPLFSVLAEAADMPQLLFKKVESSGDHVLSHLLTPKKETMQATKPSLRTAIQDTPYFIHRMLNSDNILYKVTNGQMGCGFSSRCRNKGKRRFSTGPSLHSEVSFVMPSCGRDSCRWESAREQNNESKPAIMPKTQLYHHNYSWN